MRGQTKKIIVAALALAFCQAAYAQDDCNTHEHAGRLQEALDCKFELLKRQEAGTDVQFSRALGYAANREAFRAEKASEMERAFAECGSVNKDDEIRIRLGFLDCRSNRTTQLSDSLRAIADSASAAASMGGVSATSAISAEIRRENVYPYGYTTVLAIKSQHDRLTINALTLNRGNCTPFAERGFSFPVSLRFGDEKSFVIEHCSVSEATIGTNFGDAKLTFGS